MNHFFNGALCFNGALSAGHLGLMGLCLLAQLCLMGLCLLAQACFNGALSARSCKNKSSHSCV